MNLSEELLTKEDYQRALYSISMLLDEATGNLNTSKRQVRSCMSGSIRNMIKLDIKSKDAQVAYIISHHPEYEVIFNCYDDNLETYNRLLRLREDILKLMSFNQTEIRVMQ